MATVEFFEDTHEYLVDGIQVPSVTTLIKKIIPGKYDDVNPAILKKKAEYGTKGHKCIEEIDKYMMDNEEALDYIRELRANNEINKDLEISLREYIRLRNKYQMEAIANEMVVYYKNEFVGTLDKIALINGLKNLIDIKFTAELDKEYLSWQLGMYRMAYKWLYGEDLEISKCLWLPKKKLGQLADIIPKTEEEILKKLEELKEYEHE